MMDRDPARLTVASGLFACTPSIVAGGDASEAIAALTDGEGFDVVFDATGSRQSIEAAFAYVASGGRYVLVSIVKGDITFTDAEFHRKELTLLGSRNATLEDFTRVMSAIRAGSVRSEEWISHRTSLADAGANLPVWAKSKTGLIKAVIEVV